MEKIMNGKELKEKKIRCCRMGMESSNGCC